MSMDKPTFKKGALLGTFLLACWNSVVRHAAGAAEIDFGMARARMVKEQLAEIGRAHV